ncbi:c-type cytochrome [Pontixanthobacter aestiaquae]|uniref:C-type cytochrome n=1 Tax=Pontixanthobacter aestiaquae TaxID=1509367 RepID=A0A844Z2A1_9SPHN|nr:c-type cytochrome [Pontixanthobacter aestiaquae]MDN3647226.1 c-type cytochrome [Pontixanthobacter aestiaquae]MXO81798.1 c-type cytochrome [Pontixanthobacter aestiaquae]
MKRLALITIIATLGLSACSSESPEPVEQIIVRTPGETVPAVETSDGDDLVTTGRKAFAACVACHAVEQGEPSGAGPNLFGIVGRQAGTLADFAYSDAMTGADFTWNAEQLEAFLANPAEKVPGTTMVTGAVTDPERRSAIAAYLVSLTE